MFSVFNQKENNYDKLDISISELCINNSLREYNSSNLFQSLMDMITDSLFADLLKDNHSSRALDLAASIAIDTQSEPKRFEAASRYLDARHNLLMMAGYEDCKDLSKQIKIELKKLEENFLKEI